MEKRSFGVGIKESFFKDNLEKSMQPNNKGYILTKFSNLLAWARSGSLMAYVFWIGMLCCRNDANRCIKI